MYMVSVEQGQAVVSVSFFENEEDYVTKCMHYIRCGYQPIRNEVGVGGRAQTFRMG